MRLALWARTAGEIEEVAGKVREGGGEAIAVQCDVADWHSVQRAADETLEYFGAIDVLVNNAGIGGPRGPVVEVDPDRWAQTIAIDLTGQFYCMRAVLPTMIRQWEPDRSLADGL